MTVKVKESPSQAKAELALKYRTSKFFDSKDGYQKYQSFLYVMEKANEEHFGSKEVDFSKLSIKEKTYHGWLRPIAFLSETIINGRWDYWLDIRATHQVEGKDIPQLKFLHSGSNEFNFVSVMIQNCLNKLSVKGIYGYDALRIFIDWLLHGFGSHLVKELPREVTDEINQFWYENFKAQYMFLYPADYFVVVAAKIYGNRFNANAFYPTPSCIVDMMVRMIVNEEDKEKNKYSSAIDPTAGSGIMMLYMSNYSLRLHAVDIDPLMCKIATINGYLYIPWLVETDDETSELLNNMNIKYNKGVE
jgi:hypothetical protein